MRLSNDQLALSPSDLNTFLACSHATGLDLRRARGEITLHKAPRPDAELVAERGRRHEQAYLAGLREEGRDVVVITEGDEQSSLEGAAAGTAEAMRSGAEVIYQATFVDPSGWRGRADFLIRIDEPSDLGGFAYEVHDTKLAKHPKPYFIVQLAFYTEQVARLQGRMPERMHVVLGTDETRSYRYEDFSAYVRRVRSRLLEHLAEDAPLPYPYPVEHCDYCDWWARCRDKRRADDHLSLVAGLGRSQAVKLEAAGIPTVRALASAPPEQRVPQLAQDTLGGLRLQAELQIHTRDTCEHVRRFVPLEEGRGFFRLPASSPGDVFFDIEGDPYWGDEGLEYLLGSYTLEGG
jgi:predicted RecB family nuclease